MKINNLIGVSGSINSGKDLVGEMLCYISQSETPTYDGFRSEVVLECPYEIKKCADKLKEVVALIIGCKRKDLEDEVFKNTPLPEQWWYYTREFSGGEHARITRLEFNELEEVKKGYWKLVKLTPRAMLQLLGTEGGRKQVHPNIWVNALFADYIPETTWDSDKWNEPISKWIITDVRFPENEGVAVTERGGLLIGIKRNFALKQPKYAHLVDPLNPYDIPRELEELDNKLYKSLTHDSEISMGDHSWCDVVIENNGTIEELFDKVLKAVR